MITAAQDIGTEDDAALYLRAKTCPPRLAVHVNWIEALDASAVANAIEPSKVRAGFGSGNNIIGGNRVLRVGQGNLDYLRPQAFQLFNRNIDGAFHFRVQTADPMFLCQAKLEPVDLTAQTGRVARNW